MSRCVKKILSGAELKLRGKPKHKRYWKSVEGRFFLTGAVRARCLCFGTLLLCVSVVQAHRQMMQAHRQMMQSQQDEKDKLQHAERKVYKLTKQNGHSVSDM